MSFDSDFTVGVEEELMLVGAEPPHGLATVAADVLERVPLSGELLGHEAYAAEVELRSPVCTSAGEAASHLHHGRAALGSAGAALLGAGLHPGAAFGDAELVATPRYQRVLADMRGLIQRTPECALHVHVGMPDAQTAMNVLNGMRAWLPLLQALSANSPWWFGRDSGLASARWAMVRAYPGRGAPPVFPDFAAYQQLVESTRQAGGFADYTHLWWDARPHPQHGTVEIREMDAQTTVEDAQALVALVHALARREAEAPRREHLPAEAIGWSAFRGARDGIAAEVLDGDGVVRPAATIATELVRDLGRDGSLEGVERLVHAGGGAARQRVAAARGGLPALLEDLVARSAMDTYPST